MPFTANLRWLANRRDVNEVVMTKNRSFPGLVFVVIAGLGVFATLAMYKVSFSPQSFWIMVCAIVLAFIVSSAIQVADQWSKAVVLRLGKFHALQGPGLFFIVPLIDTIPYWIDIRVLTSSFKAEKTLTKDTVPVDVDAVLFWKIIDPKKAALDVADYQSAISWASQTALRDVIGKTMLSDMLEGRDKISGVLQKLLTNAPNPGVST
jgi:regulator of protease activity HflC (stomatin/prohibitin superfamily)